MLKKLTKNTFFTFANLISCIKLVKIDSNPRPTLNMSDIKAFKRARYDGRSKKRQWEERRSDKGEAIGSATPSKKTKNEDIETVQLTLDKVKRRKFCLLMGYSGVGYYGMQRNPHTKTIEEDLFKALFKIGLINEDCYNQVQNMQFQRAARTDKGVSAARQIVSLKLAENIDLGKINAELPEVIRVFAYKRVTKGFNSKSQCDSRTYIYMLPTVAFADKDQDISQKDYRLGEEKLNTVNTILQNFVGTKNFHNYTSKKKPNDPSANRYIKLFDCEKPFVRNEVEFTVLKVQGQSFMMHQIRKMVGCLIAVVKGLASVDIIKDSFQMEKVNVPRAPGLGLVLDYVHYDRYNNRYGTDGMHEKLTWEDVEDEINNFKEKYIYPTIVETEIKEESMIYWIKNKLSRHSYDLDEEDNDSGDEGEDDEDNDKDEIIDNQNSKTQNVSN
ncbi:tRNA pseudouridine synthase A [Anoplophora glabripennis]|uniref:tRNA pseudouridine synthase A n=1 Tax=Anoplophora glabripennis TaxID=217634 RepID=UPI0008750FDE|nr:tRNA pseudouridine synthase A [Anoplophora glabripennis]